MNQQLAIEYMKVTGMVENDLRGKELETHFLAFDFAPLLHSWSSTAAFLEFSTAAF